MKLRRVNIANSIHVQAQREDSWVNLSSVSRLQDIAAGNGVQGDDLAGNMLKILQLGDSGWADLDIELQSSPAAADLSSNDAVMLPVEPLSFRDFMLFEQHAIDSTRGYAKRFMPSTFKLVTLYEKLFSCTFPKLKPHKLWYKQPIYYFGNHLNFYLDGSQIDWPEYTNALDYELELGAVLAHPLLDASAKEAKEAIGGFIVLNDFSARDQQKEEMESGFGPQRAKHFANSMSSSIVTADEMLPKLDSLSGGIRINGKLISRCRGSEMRYNLSDAISFISTGEKLHPGELVGTGTIPGGCGMENGIWLKPGDELSMYIDGLDQLTNTISNVSKNRAIGVSS